MKRIALAVLLTAALPVSAGAAEAPAPNASAAASLLGESSGLPGGLCVVLERTDADWALGQVVVSNPGLVDFHLFSIAFKGTF